MNSAFRFLAIFMNLTAVRAELFVGFLLFSLILDKTGGNSFLDLWLFSRILE